MTPRQIQTVVITGIGAVVVASSAGWTLTGYWWVAFLQLFCVIGAASLLVMSGVWHRWFHSWPISPGWCPHCAALLNVRKRPWESAE
jgi:hypothetical protein